MLTVALACALALVAIWILYPLAIAALAAMHPARSPDASADAATQRSVSVILATRDDPALVRARIDDIFASEFPVLQLDVVVGVDRTADAPVAEYECPELPVRVVQGDAPGGKGAALNAAVRAAIGDILVFTDSAQRFEPSAIRLLVGQLEDVRVGMVSGALHLGRHHKARSLSERYWIFERWLRAKEAQVHSTVGVTGAVYAMRRDRWLPLPSGVLLDDLYGPMRLVLRGYRIGFCSEAIAFDPRRIVAKQEYRRKVRTLTGVLQVCAWLPDVLWPFRNPIWLQFVFHKLLRLVTPYLLLVMLMSAGYTVGSYAVSLRPATGPASLGAMGTLILALSFVAWRWRSAIATGLAMQVAVLRATINGIRGNWDVWSR